MKMTTLIMSLLIIIHKFNICDSSNTYPVSGCKAATDDCDNWCDDQENGNGNCWKTWRDDLACFWSIKCYCECTWKDSLSDALTFSAPFEIKLSSNGKCLDWYQDGTFKVGLFDCHGGDNQKWVYYPNNKAVKSSKPYNGKHNCLSVPYGKRHNGHDLDIWSDNDCVNWESSQFTFLADGHIRTDIASYKYLDIENGVGYAQIWDWSDSSNQIFTFPAGTLRGNSISEACQVNKLEKVAEESTDELAETAWNLGTTIAGEIPVVGSAVGIITSIWNPTENEGPSATELVNNVRDEINQVVDQLKECMDAKIKNLELEIEQNNGIGYVSQVTTRLEAIAGASGDDQMDKIMGLFEDFNGWITAIFTTKDHYLDYENLIPIYESLVPLWAVIAQETLIIQIKDNDCDNYQNDLKTIRARFATMFEWISKAIHSIILTSTIKIVDDNNVYNEWIHNQFHIFGKKYLAPIDFYIESLDDISPNLELSCVDGKFAETDNIITVYKYTKDINGDITLSANRESKVIQNRGFIMSTDDIVTYTLYDKPMENTSPVYKKYNVEYDDYWITINKDAGIERDYKIVSILGYCSILQNNPSVTSCHVYEHDV